MSSFPAIVIRQDGDRTRASLEQLTAADLPAGEVLVEVEYSSLNFKDALAVTGKGKIMRSFPLAAGVDLAGTVLESNDPRFFAGDRVVANGGGLGSARWGGYSGQVRVPADSLLQLPSPLTTASAMSIGTAGFTALQCILALEDQGLATNAPARAYTSGDCLVPPAGSNRPAEVVVTGATGGVGSFAVMLLAQRGCRVTAVSGSQEHEWLRELGAAEIITRDELQELAGRPMASERWDAAVDVAGGNMLVAVLASLRKRGSAAACGLAAGSELNTTVFPFILRGISLLGIDSDHCPRSLRERIWTDLARTVPESQLADPTEEITLEEVPTACERLLEGGVRGRIRVRVKSQS